MDTLVKMSLFAAVTFTGILCGASLDQSFKQLPARHRIGSTAFSIYARAADLKNGVWWYALIGIGSALFTLLSAFLVWKHQLETSFTLPIYIAGISSIGHSICTTQAAPLYFRQNEAQDERSLYRLFDRFELIQSIRSIFITLNFAGLLAALFTKL